MMFATRYTLPNGETRRTQCYADSPEHLQEVMRLRGMGETDCSDEPSYFGISPPTLPSSWLARGEYAKAIHALTWVSMIAVKSGVDAWTLLHDEGLMHELAHLNENAAHEHSRRSIYSLYETRAEGDFNRAARLRLVEKLVAFEKTIPGLMESPAEQTRIDARNKERDHLIALMEPSMSKAMKAYAKTLLDGDPKLDGITKHFEGLGLTGKAAKVMAAQVASPDKLTSLELKTALLPGQVLVFDEFSMLGSNHNINIRATYPTPGRTKHGSRRAGMDSVAQGKAAKAALVEKMRAKAVKAPPSEALTPESPLKWPYGGIDAILPNTYQRKLLESYFVPKPDAPEAMIFSVKGKDAMARDDDRIDLKISVENTISPKIHTLTARARHSQPEMQFLRRDTGKSVQVERILQEIRQAHDRLTTSTLLGGILAP